MYFDFRTASSLAKIDWDKNDHVNSIEMSSVKNNDEDRV